MMNATKLSILASLTCLVPGLANAQPDDYTDLGEHLGPECFSVPVQLQAANDVQWFRIVLPAVSADGGYIDIRSEYPHEPLGSTPLGNDWLELPDMLVFSDTGLLVTGSSGWLYEFPQIAVSLGDTDPRPAQCVYYDDPYDPHYACGPVFNGFSDAIATGVYWVAVGQSRLVGAQSAWMAYSTQQPNANRERRTTLIFTIQPAGVPYCDPDLNWDGNADAGDIDYLINVIAGGDNPTGRNPDFNHDGNADQGDIDALVNVVAGGGCP